MNKVINALVAAIAALTFLTTLSSAQTKSQLDEKYSKVNAYLVRPNILLTARYSSDGKVCDMALQPVRWTGDSVELFSLSEEEAIRVVEEIVPESERGKKLGGLLRTDDKISVFSGQALTTPYTYEKITINFTGITGKNTADMVAVVTWRDRSCK